MPRVAPTPERDTAAAARGGGRRVDLGTVGPAAAAAALVTGAVLVGVGGGLGLPHLARAGWSPVTVVGLLVLGLGVALTGMGLVRLVRVTRGWWRVPVALGGAVVVLLVVDLVAVPVAATMVPPDRADGRTPASVGLAYREVRLPVRLGQTLAAWYVPTRNGAAVVLLHGSGSTRSSTLEQAAVLARHGYGVLLVDARGHGASTGRAMDLGWHGDGDVAAATAYLSSPQSGADPRRIAAVGLSMGGEEALGALAVDSHLAAVVAEGVTGRQAADLGWLSVRYGWRGQLQEGVEAVHTWLATALSGLAPPRTVADGVRQGRAPVLLVTAGERPDEGYAAAALRAAAPGRVSVWTVPGSDHTAGLATAPAQWERHVVGFLDRVLQPV